VYYARGYLLNSLCCFRRADALQEGAGAKNQAVTA
jgi:hypothetical protein